MDPRVPPQEIQAEKSILGSILIDIRALDTAIEMLSEESFYISVHKKIFEAIKTLNLRSEPVDIITLSAELSKTNSLETIGGESYLSELVENSSMYRNTEHHCKILLSAQTRRQIIETAQWMSRLGYDDKETPHEDLIDSIESKIFSIRKTQNENRFYHPREIFPELIDDMEAVAKSGIAPGLLTGFTRLDKQIGGLQNGDLVIIGGRPSMGKTAFAVCMAANICKREPDSAIAFFSMEMVKKSIMRRIVAAEHGIEYGRIMSSNLTHQERAAIRESMIRVGEYNILIDDTALLTPMQQRAKLRTLMRKHNVVLVICDYTGLMECEEKGKSREQTIAAISRGQKRIAKEFNIPYVALCQLNRLSAQNKGDKRPALTDLRDSGAQEQDADLVMFCHREEYYDRSKDKGIAEIIIGKQRNGPTGIVKLAFRESYMLFSNLEQEEPKIWQNNEGGEW